MATSKGKSTKSSGKSGAAKGKGPGKVSLPAIAMANLKGKKAK